MQFATAALLPALAAGFIAIGPRADAAPARPDSTRIGGREYLNVGQWAAANGFRTRWLQRDETLQLSNASSTVVLKAATREAQINGVKVWLSFAVVAKSGNLFVSRLDCQATLEPILFPSRSTPRLRVRTICLDPGHGGRDPGNQVGASQEKRYNLLLAQEVRDQLTRAGFKVILTRTTDTAVDLAWRPLWAKRHKADAFLSLHFNAAGSSRQSVKGCEVYCLTPSGATSTNAQGERGPTQWVTGNRFNSPSTVLAYLIHKSLVQTLAAEDRGVRRARFAVLREAAMPAALIEAGFMSHPVERQKILKAEYRRQIARAITSGVTAFQRAVERD